MASKIKRQRLVFSEKLMYAFINDYKESTCLWDFKHPDYKCAEKRKAALGRLASKYGITEEEAKRKLNSLRSTYLQEKKKVEESKKLGGEVYEPTLYWFHELEFLYDVIIPRKTPCHVTTPKVDEEQEQVYQPSSSQDGDTNEEEEVDQEHLIFEFVPEGEEKGILRQKLEHSYTIRHQARNSGTNLMKPRKTPSVGQQQFSDPDVLPNWSQPHERVCQSPPPPPLPSLNPLPVVQRQVPDEFDKFCSSIASQLRTLPPAHAIEMQLEIQQLVSRRRLAVLKNTRTSLPRLPRGWENATDGFHTYSLPNSRPSAMDDDSGQEDGNENIILGT